MNKKSRASVEGAQKNDNNRSPYRHYQIKILTTLKIIALSMFLLSEILILAFIAIDAGNLDAGYLSPLRGPAHIIFFSFLAVLLTVIIYRSKYFDDTQPPPQGLRVIFEELQKRFSNL